MTVAGTGFDTSIANYRLFSGDSEVIDTPLSDLVISITDTEIQIEIPFVDNNNEALSCVFGPFPSGEYAMA